jgi:hypothetical protein
MIADTEASVPGPGRDLSLCAPQRAGLGPADLAGTGTLRVGSDGLAAT